MRPTARGRLSRGESWESWDKHKGAERGKTGLKEHLSGKKKKRGGGVFDEGEMAIHRGAGSRAN